MNNYGRTIDPNTTKVIDNQLAGPRWRPATIRAEITGLPRPVQVIRGKRTRKTLLTFDWHGNKDTFCPPVWWDLAVGAGACGYGCRSCFLMLTHRAFNDPLRHRLYDNLDDYYDTVSRWLQANLWPHPTKRGEVVKLNRRTTLGLGIDRSDSLLYEGVTGHARRLIPLFVSPKTNPDGRRLVLLTKSANTHYLDWRQTDPEFPAFSRAGRTAFEQQGRIPNVSVTFSLNPDPVADLWEGKYPDTLERITPHTDRRLAAAKLAADLGFEVRWRLDPVLPVDGWQDLYRAWLAMAVTKFEAQPARITLGTYREKNACLDLWRKKWGLPPMEWQPPALTHAGTHFRPAHLDRLDIYHSLRAAIDEAWRGRVKPQVAVCKESHTLRRKLGLMNDTCNCLM